MLVKEVMTRDVITCAPAEPLAAIVKLMGEKDISGLPVVDHGKLVGIITEGDIMKILAGRDEQRSLWLPSPFEVLLEMPFRDIIELRRLQESFRDVGEKPVRDVMTKDVVVIEPENDIEDAASLMVRYKINRLPVVENLRNRKLVGVITREDIIQSLGGKK